MSGQRIPIAIIQARGAKHLTKEEIEKRTAEEVQPCMDCIEPPAYLTAAQKKEFTKIADQLKKLKVIGETDVDALARYIVANDNYINTVRQMRKPDVKADPFMWDLWGKAQDRYFKQCRASASDLGLTISSRCRLVVPQPADTKKKANKFSKFEKRGSA